LETLLLLGLCAIASFEHSLLTCAAGQYGASLLMQNIVKILT